MISPETENAIRAVVRLFIKQKINNRTDPNSVKNPWMNYSGSDNPNGEGTMPARYWALPGYTEARHYIQSSMNCTATEDDPNGPLKITVYLRYDVKKTSVNSNGGSDTSTQGPPGGTLNYEAFNAYVEGIDPGALNPGGSYGTEEDTLNPSYVGAAGITITNDTHPGCIVLLRNGVPINPSA